MAKCQTPFTIRDLEFDRTIPVPCGRCPNCIARRISAWSFRLMEEERNSKSAHFITLTYDPLKMSKDSGHITQNGYMQISKRDVQLFFKRLRRRNAEKIKYYAVGEYGGKTLRPHYHAIIYNVELPTIQPAWDQGHIHYGTVTGASIGYCMKYMCKKGKIPLHRNDDRQPEFGLMSKGIGECYLNEQMVKWHRNVMNDRMYCTTVQGQKIAMPRYYKNKIYSKAERATIGEVLAHRMEEELIEEMANQGEQYYRNQFYNDEAAFRKMWKSAHQKTFI